MTTTTRRKKTPPATVEPMPTTHQTVNIIDICKAKNVTEQAFRLALMDIRPDDFDTIKSLPTTQSEQVLATLAATKTALPAPTVPTDTTPENAESLLQQAIDPTLETATEQPQKPQNSGIVASGSNGQVTQPNQPVNGLAVPTALDELIAAAEEDIDLADLVLIYRNQQISQNKQARDGELVQQLRQSRSDNRAKTFDALRELNSRQPIAPELEELPESLSSEIDRLALELGKQLSLGR